MKLMYSAAWRPEFKAMYKGVEPQKVADEITEIGESATPDQIVEKARDEKTELHKCFEWDDEKAAEKYRLVQARQIVRHLVIEEKKADDGDGQQAPVRFFVQTRNGDGYKPVEWVLKRDDEYRQLLLQALAELHAFKEKYSRLSELQEILDMIA